MYLLRTRAGDELYCAVRLVDQSRIVSRRARPAWANETRTAPHYTARSAAHATTTKAVAARVTRVRVDGGGWL
eukprot:scaffold16790_cov101-Isochrysis_galbana.AAC.4